MAKTRKPLLVPVRLPRPGIPDAGGILHDTDCARGAQSREDADRINAECMAAHGHCRWGAEYVMEEVQPFEASLRVVKYYHYKSSVHVELEDTTGRRYPMFLGDLVPLLSDADMDEGWLSPRTYEACKKSTAYGIRPVAS